MTWRPDEDNTRACRVPCPNSRRERPPDGRIRTPLKDFIKLVQLDGLARFYPYGSKKMKVLAGMELHDPREVASGLVGNGWLGGAGLRFGFRNVRTLVVGRRIELPT